MISNLESFYGQDITTVLGGAALAFWYLQLTKLVGGVPLTLAVGYPVSRKSTAVECAMPLFQQKGMCIKRVDAIIQKEKNTCFE